MSRATTPLPGLAIAQRIDTAALTAEAAPIAADFLHLVKSSGGARRKVTVGTMLGIVAGLTGLTDNRLLRADGTDKVQSSVATLSDAGALSGLTQLDADNLRLDGNDISTQNANGNLTLTPNGTGTVTVKNSLLVDVGNSGENQMALYSDTAGEVVVESIANTGGAKGQIYLAKYGGTVRADSLLCGATALIGSERLRIAGGSVATPGSTDVTIGGGLVYAGGQIVSAQAGGGGSASFLAFSINPSICMFETDGSADNKSWDFHVGTEQLTGRIINDANSAANNWLSVDRTGTTVDLVTIGINGSAAVGKPSLATNATSGFCYVPTCAGTPTGAPTAVTGFAPIVIDSTNNKLYFYSGGAWRDAGP